MVLRMTGGEDVKRNWFTPYLVVFGIMLFYDNGNYDSARLLLHNMFNGNFRILQNLHYYLH